MDRRRHYVVCCAPRCLTPIASPCSPAPSFGGSRRCCASQAWSKLRSPLPPCTPSRGARLVECCASRNAEGMARRRLIWGQVGRALGGIVGFVARARTYTCFGYGEKQYFPQECRSLALGWKPGTSTCRCCAPGLSGRGGGTEPICQNGSPVLESCSNAARGKYSRRTRSTSMVYCAVQYLWMPNLSS